MHGITRLYQGAVAWGGSIEDLKSAIKNSILPHVIYTWPFLGFNEANTNILIIWIDLSTYFSYFGSTSVYNEWQPHQPMNYVVLSDTLWKPDADWSSSVYTWRSFQRSKHQLSISKYIIFAFYMSYILQSYLFCLGNDEVYWSAFIIQPKVMWLLFGTRTWPQ